MPVNSKDPYKTVGKILEMHKNKKGEIDRKKLEELRLYRPEQIRGNLKGRTQTFWAYEICRNGRHSRTNYRWLAALTAEQYEKLARKDYINGTELLSLLQ